MKFDANSPAPKQDLTGQYFSDWYVLNFYGRVRGTPIYTTRCKCGTESFVSGPDLLREKSKRCRSCSTIERYKRNPNSKIGSKAHTWKGTKDIPKAQYSKIRYSAKIRGILFDLTIEDLQEIWDSQQGKCVYTGRPMFFNNKSFKVTDRKGKHFDFASLDRIDSTKGYVVGNVQWVLQSVNIAKQVYFHDEFLKLIRDIHDYCILRKT